MAGILSHDVDGMVKQREQLDHLLMSNPDMEKRVQKLIRKVLMTARREVAKAASQPSVMKSDPRHAYRAVKSAVYKRILGGSVSILNKRRLSGKTSDYEPPRKKRPTWARGGNRVPRSARTQQVMDYEGADRAFILRFINQGTGNREAGTRNGGLHGNRGSIRARNFFSNSSHKAMQQAAAQLTDLIDELIRKELR